MFHLLLRAPQGFVMRLRKLAFANLPVPNYTTLSRRAQDLDVVLLAALLHKSNLKTQVHL